MSTTGQRIKGLRLYNNYSLAQLSSDLYMEEARLKALEADEAVPDVDEAKDLSSRLGADASYISGLEGPRYIAYAHVAYKLQKEGLVETEAWEQAFIDCSYDIYDMTVIVYDEEDEELKKPRGTLLFCESDEKDGLCLVEYEGRVVLATKKGPLIERHQQKIQARYLYHVAFSRPDLEDMLLDITKKIKSGEINID